MSSGYYLHGLGIINALGSGAEAVAQGLFSGNTSGLMQDTQWSNGKPAIVGRARGELVTIPAALSHLASHNNALLLTAYQQIATIVDAAIHQYGRHRIGVVLGTSTSGMAEGEAALRQWQQSGTLPPGYRYLQQELGAPALFLSQYLELHGPAYTVSTACTSSAKAFQSARNLLKHDICDAVIVGGVDSMCSLTIQGFTSLESTSSTLCQPMSQHRQGINIGEGAALFLLSREPGDVALLGIGETSDAYHMSAPSPDGQGAESAMRAALADAQLQPEDIDYLNLHATATLKNDEMESHAVSRVFSQGVPCSGTKPLTGHTLGAAGATELAFCWLALQHGMLPPHCWDHAWDDALPRLQLVDQSTRLAPRICMSNSFAFGGSNASLIIGLSS
ncbi:beta-ketoacyl-[acyl-carrier-protein] synthase family protein [Methylobacillus methanolivorans]|uniref:Beta-ketoacyl-[acyl-carrier-protein] synthase family protein n=1 Tax=Methylobacillus methanolivorans TaxID=1848927 RepID=A0ABW8GHC2_9PROT